MSKDIPNNFPPCNWLGDARILNQKYERIPNYWIMHRVDAIVLYFSLRNVDRDDIIHKFYTMYENARHINLPIEVINIPMDETKEDMCFSYDEQANWFTLMFNDPLIIHLKYMYDITSVPHLVVMRTDGSIVSYNGILDLDEYGMNALITWLSSAAASTPAKRLSKEMEMYGPNWKYAGSEKPEKPTYQKKFSLRPVSDEPVTSLGMAVRSRTSRDAAFGTAVRSRTSRDLQRLSQRIGYI